MSKISNNLIKEKIESIAKKFVKKKEDETSEYLNKFKKDSIDNDLTLSKITLKDSLSCLEEFKNSFTKENNIKKFQTNFYNNNNSKITAYKSKYYSSICTKKTISSENNENLNNLFKNENCDNKNINDESKIISILLGRINFDIIKDLKNIYEKLLLLFNEIKYISNKNNSKKNENGGIINNNNNNFMNQSKILSFHYVKILLSDNMENITKIFYNSIEINKFLLYQIYLFISIIYLDEEKLNEYLLLSYKTILLYSSQNFENINKILMDFSQFYENKKISKKISILNKIIISILKTLTKIIPSNSDIMYYISPVKDIEININEDNAIDQRISGINNLLTLLKANKDLNQKLIDIEMKEIQLMESNYNNDNGIKENNTISENNKNEENITGGSEAEYEDENNTSNIKTVLILPDMDINEFKYTVLFQLDETLVHYCEENDNYFVKVRFGSENLIEYMHNFCEIIIVSTSGIEYSDIIVNNLNKNRGLISHRIYSEEYENIDLSEINRDKNTMFVICSDEDFLNAPKENIIKLKEFNGDEKDKEFVKLLNEFKNIENLEIKDVRNIIPNIKSNITKSNE